MIKDIEKIDINQIGKGTAKTLEQAILDGLEICAIDSEISEGMKIIIGRCVREYLAQGLAGEMIQAKSPTEIQIIERLAQLWKINR